MDIPAQHRAPYQRPPMKDLAANVPSYAYLLGGFVLSLSYGFMKLHAVLQANGLGGVQ